MTQCNASVAAAAAVADPLAANWRPLYSFNRSQIACLSRDRQTGIYLFRPLYK